MTTLSINPTFSLYQPLHLGREAIVPDALGGLAQQIANIEFMSTNNFAGLQDTDILGSDITKFGNGHLDGTDVYDRFDHPADLDALPDGVTRIGNVYETADRRGTRNYDLAINVPVIKSLERALAGDAFLLNSLYPKDSGSAEPLYIGFESKHVNTEEILDTLRSRAIPGLLVDRGDVTAGTPLGPYPASGGSLATNHLIMTSNHFLNHLSTNDHPQYKYLFQDQNNDGQLTPYSAERFMLTNLYEIGVKTGRIPPLPAGEPDPHISALNWTNENISDGTHMPVDAKILLNAPPFF